MKKPNNPKYWAISALSGSLKKDSQGYLLSKEQIESMEKISLEYVSNIRNIIKQ